MGFSTANATLAAPYDGCRLAGSYQMTKLGEYRNADGMKNPPKLAG
jgi:hypothetical protein